MKFISMCTILLTVNFALGNCQNHKRGSSYSTSVAAMTYLWDAERLLAKIIANDLKDLQAEDDTIQNFINKVNEEHEKSANDSEGYLSNPLNSFALIRRTQEDWFYIIESLKKSRKKEVEDILKDNGMALPSREDMVDAVKGMERIRKIYKLLPKDIAEGRLNGEKYHATLSISDLFSIGFELFKMQKYTEAVSWLNVSLYSHFESMLPSKTLIERKDASLLLSDALLRSSEHSESESDDDYMEIFEKACRGEDIPVCRKFHCLNNNTMHPYLALAPSKMEILSKDPYVLIYHDVLSNREINEIINKARNHLRRAKVFSEDSSSHSDVRTTHDASVKLSVSTMRKILAITGLNQEGFEEASVLNYGLGGHYEPHEDFFYPLKDTRLESVGDRIATILIYLSDVDQGGATVFPKVGLSVKPQRGSLLLWYNLKNNGEVDYDTLHGACPVIVGSKWALTIWVRERAQFRNLPCYDP